MFSKQEQMLLAPGATIREAMERLNSLGKSPIVFTVDEAGKVTGCVTDGDIRRALLHGESLATPIEKISRKSFVSVKESATPSRLLGLMRRKGVRQIPVLDAEGRLKNVHFLEEFESNRSLREFPVVIMAGGKGTRLGPYTDNVPKPLLKVGEQPIIERTITELQARGVTEFYITVNHLADMIVDHLGDGERFGCRIHYVRESEPLGTAGSLRLLRNRIETEFMVINGDVLSSIDISLLADFHAEHKAVATVCAKMFTVTIPYGVVKINRNDLVAIEEKPDISFTVNSGIYFFSPEVLGFLTEEGSLNMPTLLERLVAAGKPVKCFQSMEPWIDIGSKTDFERAQKYLEYLTR